MSSQSWVQTLIAQQVDGTALTNTVTATSIIAPAAKFTLPINFLAIGTMLRVRAKGRVSTLVTTPGTLLLEVRFGATTVVFSGGAMALNIAAQTNATWTLDADLVVRSIGTAATILGIGEFNSRVVIGSGAAGTAGVGELPLPDTAPAVGTSFDSTATQVVDLFATWSVANAANSILTHVFTLECLN